MEKKPIKFKDKIEYLTLEEVCTRFEGLVYGLCKRWTIRYDIEDLKQIVLLAWWMHTGAMISLKMYYLQLMRVWLWIVHWLNSEGERIWDTNLQIRK